MLTTIVMAFVSTMVVNPRLSLAFVQQHVGSGCGRRSGKEEEPAQRLYYVQHRTRSFKTGAAKRRNSSPLSSLEDNSLRHLRPQIQIESHDATNLSPVMVMTPPNMFLRQGRMKIPSLSHSPGVISRQQQQRQERQQQPQEKVGVNHERRGILGFVVDSNALPTSSLSSSQLMVSRSTTNVDVDEWNVPRPMSNVWSDPRNRSPILNRSPTTGSTPQIPAWLPWLPTMSQISSLTLQELQQVCMERGLKHGGTQIELQSRMSEWTKEQRQGNIALSLSESGKSVPASSLSEWVRSYDIEPLQQRREQIHKEKRDGKPVKSGSTTDDVTESSSPLSPFTGTTEEYRGILKKLFIAPAAEYSNLEVKQMYAAAKEADQRGNRFLAKQILSSLVKAVPNDARIFRRMSRMESEDGNIMKAREILQEGIRAHPSNPHLQHGLGQLELKFGSSSIARDSFKMAIKLDPSFPNPYHALGTQEHSQGEIAKAMKTLKTGLKYCPKNHRLHHALGDLYFEAKMLDMAQRCYRRALEVGPQVSRGFAYNSLAYVAYEKGNVDKSRSWLRKALSLNKGRHSKGWVALGQLEESEGNIDAARYIYKTALSGYEAELIRRYSPWVETTDTDLANITSSSETKTMEDPTGKRTKLLKLAPPYRSGDHFLVVYRNWARLEEKYGSAQSVNKVYKQASIVFPKDWKLRLDCADYNAKMWLEDEARELFVEACEKASYSHADPYRLFAEFEMSRGSYLEARKILFNGARTISQSPGSGLINRNGMVELFHTWGVCEWYCNNLPRAEILFDHALRLIEAGDTGSELRSVILYSIARLQYHRKEYVLSQHCIGLCLKENRMPGGNVKIWELWGEVAKTSGNERLALKCKEQVEKLKSDLGLESGESMTTVMTGKEIKHLMRKGPWHHKIFKQESPSRKKLLNGVRLPPLPKN